MGKIENKLDLQLVDLIAISSVRIEETIKSLKLSMLSANFKSVKFLTHVDKESFAHLDIEGIDFIKINEIKTHLEYSDFCLRLNNYLDSDFILIVQNDSFITNNNLWSDEFLDYDYIGAPWTEQQAKDWGIPNRVGNGGFSLRSRKFLQYASQFDSTRGANEDGFLTNFTYQYAINFGIKYAPVEIASTFAIEKIETTYNPDNHFGFHGAHILPIAEEYVKNKFSV